MSGPILSGGTSGSSGSGTTVLTDGVDTSIKATVKDLADSNPLTVAIVDGNGDQITSFGGGTQYAEDTPSTAGEIVTMAGVVRQDTRGSLVSNDGDRTELQVNSSGDLRVDGSAVTQPISGAVSFTAPQHVIIDSGTTIVTQATGTNLHTVVDSGSITVANGAGASAVNIQDGGNSITVDGIVAAKNDVVAPSGPTTWNNATALNSAITVATAGYGVVMFKGIPTSTPNGRISFEGSTDGGSTYEAATVSILQVNPVSVVANNPNVYADFTMNTLSTTWIAYLNVQAYTHVRARVSNTISGGGSLVISAVGSAHVSTQGLPGNTNIFGTPYPSSASNLINLPVMTTGTSTNGLLVALVDAVNNVSTIKAASTNPAATDTALVTVLRDGLFGGAKGSTASAAVTSTAGGTNHQALDVTLISTSGVLAGTALGTVSNPVIVSAGGSSTLLVAGTLASNGSVSIPGTSANNLGVLPAAATNFNPTYNENAQVLLSTDLSGNLRVNLPSSLTGDFGSLSLLREILFELRAIHLQIANDSNNYFPTNDVVGESLLN